MKTKLYFLYAARNYLSECSYDQSATSLLTATDSFLPSLRYIIVSSNETCPTSRIHLGLHGSW